MIFTSALLVYAVASSGPGISGFVVVKGVDIHQSIADLVCHGESVFAAAIFKRLPFQSIH